MYSETTQEANFTYDNQGYVLDKTAFFIVHKSDHEDLILCLNAILTSKTMLWYIRGITATLGSKGFNMGKQYIEKLPIPKIPESKQQDFISIVQQILEAKKQARDTKDLESKIDHLVYKLYDLTEEEIAIIESA